MSGFFIKKFLPRTLFGRSLLILVTPVLLIQIITTVVFLDRHWSRMTGRLAFAVAGEVAAIANMLEADARGETLERVIEFSARNLDMLVSFDREANLEKMDARRYDPLWEESVAKTLRKEMEAQLRRPFDLNVNFREKWIQIAVQLDKGVLHVSVPQRRLFSTTSYIFLLWMFGSSLVLLMIAVIFMRNQVRPIRKLAAAAERFGKGRDVASFKPQGAWEVRQAGQAFLDMQRRIKRQVEQRTAMLAGVSHDLRTPLTRLKLQLAMMEGNPDAESMKKDIQDMEKMIGGYLDFVRGEGDEQAEMMDIGALLNSVAEDARRRGVTVDVQSAGDLRMMLRPMAFERCLTNILNNAGNYAQHVWISAGPVDHVVQIVIEDDGPGIPEDQYEDVFKPFYRVDSSRNTATGGVGLGLPIAMDIVHSHGGKIRLEKSGHGGLKVIIRLPV